MKCLFGMSLLAACGLCCALGQEALAPEWIAPPNPGTNLEMQVSDFRGFHRGHGELGIRIAERKCLVDVLGIVLTRAQTPARSATVDCTTNLTVGAVLKQMNVDYADIRGPQLRIFKRNEIIQTSRFFRWKMPEERKRIEAVVLEPGDVMFFTRVE